MSAVAQPALVRCANRGCPGEFEPNPVGAPRRYCPPGLPTYRDCKAARDADRKFKERAVAFNTPTRCGTMGESEAWMLSPRLKRKTSAVRDEKNELDHGGTWSRYDSLAQAWHDANVWRPSELPGWQEGLPSLDERGRREGKLRRVEQLGKPLSPRRLDCSAGTPVAQLREPNAEDQDTPGEMALTRKRLRPAACAKGGCSGCSRCDEYLTERGPEFAYSLNSNQLRVERDARREVEWVKKQAELPLGGGPRGFWDNLGHGPEIAAGGVDFGQDANAWSKRRISENRRRNCSQRRYEPASDPAMWLTIDADLKGRSQAQADSPPVSREQIEEMMESNEGACS
jgi:hypothetical protein